MQALLIALIAPALASPGLDALSSGDRARYADDRRAAAGAYRAAIDSGEPEAAAMAHLRLLSLSGNLGALVHGPALDDALAESSGPWGQLAQVDFDLMAPAFAGADPAEGTDLALDLLDALPGPAAARLFLATGNPRWLDQLRALPERDRDGMGDGMLATGRARPPDPGTWFLGIGLSGVPGQGLGAGLLFQHPDLARRRAALSLSAAATSRGSLSAAAAARGPGETYPVLGLAGYRLVSDLYTGSEGALERQDFLQSGGQLQAGGGYRPGAGQARVELLAQAQIDDFEGQRQAIYGPAIGLSWSGARGARGERRGASLAAGGELAALGDYGHALVSLDGRAFVGALGGAVGGRLTWRGELDPGAPVYQLPTAGGAIYQRGAWAGRYRAPRITTADLEQRWSLGPVLEPVIFVDAAWLSDSAWSDDAGLHWGIGTGLRLVLPPEALNVVRLDAAASDSGWSLSAGWGEVF